MMTGDISLEYIRYKISSQSSEKTVGGVPWGPTPGPIVTGLNAWPAHKLTPLIEMLNEIRNSPHATPSLIQ